MKRFLTSTVLAMISIATLGAVANADQAVLINDTADINNDGEVTLTELKNYNRAERES